MKAKKLFIYVALGLLSVVGMQSCLYEQKDIFEEGSSARLTSAMQKAQDALRSSEQGWVFEMFPGSDRGNGGYAFICKFDSLTVSVTTELAADYTEEATCYYKLTNNGGPVLTFDTYNDYIHFFATPSFSAYEGYGGEFEFLILDVQDDLITLKGTRTGNKMYMRKLTESGVNYLNALEEIQALFDCSNYKGVISDTTVNVAVDLDSRQAVFSYQVGEGVKQTTERIYAPFVVQKDRLLFYEPTDVLGKTFTEIVPNVVGDETKICLSEDLTCDPVWPEGWRKYGVYAGTYEFTYWDNTTRKDVTIPVTLTPTGDGKTFNMGGLNPQFEPVVEYRKVTGAIYLNSQRVGTKGNNQIWLCAWSIYGGGTLTWSTDAGMKTKWNGNEANPEYDWVDNELTTYNVDSFLLWQLNSSGSSVGALVDPEWYTTGGQTNRVPYVADYKFVKISD